ncbi:hypothetical protein [Paenibacillus alvei]|uniref:hypothetical protein n=1 Tax=Paenibacillus alvei TaxID=44250 RepID=UPI002280F4D0|nr:hypothetical protein [Paenibacillus alvei]MCY7485721.1 hypothetical protein [Paenibacillus alvei]
MKDWREMLPNQLPARKQTKPPYLCGCMAAMRGRWIDGVYQCVRYELTLEVFGAFPI